MSRCSRGSIALFAAAALLACATNVLAAAAPAGGWPQARGGWLIGFGVGGGSGALSGSRAVSDREFAATGGFRAGYAFDQQVALEFDYDGWTKEQNGVTASFLSGTVALSYYPGGRGLRLTGGFGYGGVDLSAQAGGTTATTSEDGFGALAGVGYEFRVKRTFALGPSINYGYVSTNTYRANWVEGEISFVWYFLPKP